MTPPLGNIPPPSQNRETQTQIQKTNLTRLAAPEHGIKCPRCDSANTKFCYYNNYSLTQPRHFCKACRRYWTNGDALRNFPVGSGCRKNKRIKSWSSSSSSSLRSLSCDPKNFQLQGLTVPIPLSLDFSVGVLPFPSPITTGVFNFNQFSSFPNVNNVPAATNALSGFHINPTTTSNSMAGLIPPNTEFWSLGQSRNSMLSHPLNITMQTMSVGGNLSSSIERLGNMVEQHQHLATVFGGPSQNGDNRSRGASVSLSQPTMMNGIKNHKVRQQKQQPILFHRNNLEILNSEKLTGGSSVRECPKIGGDTVTSTEWFFRNPYSAVTTAATTSNHHNNVDVNHVNNNCDNGALAWGDLQQQPFSALL